MHSWLKFLRSMNLVGAWLWARILLGQCRLSCFQKRFCDVTPHCQHFIKLLELAYSLERISWLFLLPSFPSPPSPLPQGHGGVQSGWGGVCAHPCAHGGDQCAARWGHLSRGAEETAEGRDYQGVCVWRWWGCVEVMRYMEVLYLERSLSTKNLTPRGTPDTQGDTCQLFVYSYG